MRPEPDLTSRSTRETNLPFEPEATSEGAAYQQRLGQRVMGVPAQDDVDAFRPAAGELSVDIKTVMAEQHDKLRAFLPHLGHHRGHALLADAERQASGNIQRGLAIGR